MWRAARPRKATAKELNRSPLNDGSSAAAPQPREGAGEDQTLAVPTATSQTTLKSALVACGVLERSDTENERQLRAYFGGKFLLVRGSEASIARMSTPGLNRRG